MSKIEVQSMLGSFGENEYLPPTWVKYLILGASVIITLAAAYFSMRYVQYMSEEGHPVSVKYLFVVLNTLLGVIMSLLLVWMPLIIYYRLKSLNRTFSDYAREEGVLLVKLDRGILFIGGFILFYYGSHGNVIFAMLMIMMCSYLDIVKVAWDHIHACHIKINALQHFRDNNVTHVESFDLHLKMCELIDESPSIYVKRCDSSQVFLRVLM